MEAKIGQNSKDVADIPTAEERVGEMVDFTTQMPPCQGIIMPKRNKIPPQLPPGPSGRSIQPAYEPQIHCLLCGTPADVHNRRKLPKGYEAFQVKNNCSRGFPGNHSSGL
ncbi:hypothetical protein BaRGS_00030489 [Batillaria attramentaria]|uniref:Uncharacterized protein n=1 Tax=Batillaria attramentaria TaxID=370345 RepID=A0ABD0JTT0_9CAEN